MENPYRIHSSIGFGFLQLLLITSIAYPTPPPPVYHNIALTRLMATVYFTIFKDKPFYLKLECAAILLDVICDTLYIQYIIHDYTYIFGVIDIVTNVLFCVFVVVTIKNGETPAAKIVEDIEEIRITCVTCCFGWKRPEREHPPHPPHPPPATASREYTRAYEMNERNNPQLYKSLASNDTNDETTPVYTYGGRQAFKPNFYKSSFGNEYIQTKVKNEFERIDVCNTGIGDVGMITGSDGTTQYVRFDDTEYGGGGGPHSLGYNHYANLFVSPYFTRDGSPITLFTGCPKIDGIGACLFIYNLIQFIYQLMMYYSIIESCREYNTAAIINTTDAAAAAAAAAPFQMERWLC
jgi:hypothetical protein